MAKQDNAVIDEVSAEDLQSQIDDLQAKLTKQELKEQEDAVEKITLPLADITLKINRQMTIIVKRVTPPELAFLCAEHHKNAGGKPVEKIQRCIGRDGEPEVSVIDPRMERLRLASRFSQKKVNAMFPGLIPTFPKTFAMAVSSGISTSLPTERLMDFEVQPNNNGPTVE